MQKRINIINGLSTAAAAIFLTQVLHEFVHLVSAWATGAQVRAFHLFAVDIELFYDPKFLFRDIVIESSASIINVLFGFCALGLFHLLKKASATVRQFFLQTAGYSLLMGFGYFLFDGVFYSPEVPGDWKSVIRMLDGSVVLRISLILIGTFGMLFTFFWLSRNVLVFAKDKQDKKERLEAAMPVLLLPYIVFGLLYLFFAIWHPLGLPDGLMIVFFQFVFGFSGLLWGFFFAVYWFKPNMKDKRFTPFEKKVSLPWILAAIVLLIFQAAVLLPGIYF